MSAFVLDRASLLAEVDASLTLEAIERELAKESLTLGLDPSAPLASGVGEWLASGAPGTRDPWIDPVDQRVAGLEATLGDGRVLTIRPAPRRAVGPDLTALLLGMRGRFGTITRAWIRVHRIGIARPTTHPLVADRDPPVNEGEAALLDSIDAALRNT